MPIRGSVSVCFGILCGLLFYNFQEAISHHYPLKYLWDATYIIGVLVSGNAHQPDPYTIWAITIAVPTLFCFGVTGIIQKLIAKKKWKGANKVVRQPTGQ